MCRPMSYVLTKTEVHVCKTGSHTDEIQSLGLKDTTMSPDFVRIELLMPNDGMKLYDETAYTYKVDQDFLPDWYNPKEAEIACRNELVKMLKTGHIKFGGDLDLRGLTSLPADAKLSAGGDLYLSGLTSLPADAKLSAGGDLDLRGLTVGAGAYKTIADCKKKIAEINKRR